MIPMPLALTLNVCDYVLIEETTRNVSLIGCFNGIRAPRSRSFDTHSVCSPPSPAARERRMSTNRYALGVGRRGLRLQREVQFPNRFVEVRILFRSRM